MPIAMPISVPGTVPTALLRTTTVLALGAVALTGCASPAPEAAPAAAAASASGAPSPQDAGHTAARGPLTVERAWAKANPAGAMTGVFGTLVNEGDSPVVLTGAAAEGIAGAVELHETVLDPDTGSTVMQRMQDPVAIDPGASYALEPGADHLMLLDLRCDLRAGDELELVLRFEDGTEQTVTAAVRDYAGAQEEYDPGAGGREGQDDGQDDGHGGDHGGDHAAGEGTGPSAEAGAEPEGCRG
ncbi:copper chaperone PCu(A)C [Kocuria sp. CPCC 205292]|uniref:copper chaperone PCu(A)C n=1 Tax=Kocuria cellulosilytica TaxID=3071451 RepID=UPI0034D68E01